MEQPFVAAMEAELVMRQKKLHYKWQNEL
jgi:hypothetical protein